MQATARKQDTNRDTTTRYTIETKRLAVAAIKFINSRARARHERNGVTWVSRNMGASCPSIVGWMEKDARGELGPALSEDQLLRALPLLAEFQQRGAQPLPADRQRIGVAYADYANAHAAEYGLRSNCGHALAAKKFGVSPSLLHWWRNGLNRRGVSLLTEDEFLKLVPEAPAELRKAAGLRKSGKKAAQHTRNTIAEEFAAPQQTRKQTTPNAPASSAALLKKANAMINYFQTRKACCPHCGEANSAGLLSYMSHHTDPSIEKYHCVGCGVDIAPVINSHFMQNHAE